MIEIPRGKSVFETLKTPHLIPISFKVRPLLPENHI